MNQFQQNPAISNPGEMPEPVNLSIDISVITEGFRAMTQDNKKIMAELSKLLNMYYDNQKLNDELKKYRQGALRQSKEDLLRSIAQIYNDRKKDLKNAEALKFILTDLKGLLEDNEVEFVKSKHEAPFDRKFMRTHAEYVVPTSIPEQDRTVAESLECGYVFFGEPIIQELVKMYKFESILAESDSPTLNEHIAVGAEVPITESETLESETKEGIEDEPQSDLKEEGANEEALSQTNLQDEINKEPESQTVIQDELNKETEVE